jgi:UDP-glucose 4-epimerase
VGKAGEGTELVEPGTPLAQDSQLSSNERAEEHLAGKKVLVTGATGFIGSHLVERLVNLGAQVTAVGPSLGWRPTVRSLVEQGRVHFTKLHAFWSLASVGRVASEFNGVEYVVHLAYAMPPGRSCLENTIADIRRNVVGTLRFVQRLPDSVSKICFASSALVYGLNPPQPVAETDCARPVTVYATGKLATETYLRLHARESGISVLVLRYATVYGPMETVPRAIPNFIRQVLAGRSPVIRGRGDDVRDYVHVLDVVNATLLALTHDASNLQVYNVGTGRGHTTREIADKTIRLAGKHVKPVYEPAKHVSNRIVCDISRARSVLGYEPRVALNEGLSEEIRWFVTNLRLWRNL